ncbi:MAG: response regulator, partial [Cyanobacteria bacterium J06555_13]
MRILLVEDDSVIAAILKKALSDEHYAVDIANDGDTGWQLISASHYDLVILDVVLPKINGLELCRRLRDRAYNMPVLLVTALDSSTKKIAGLNAGADDYITKPFELEELLARVRVLLRRVKTSILLTLEWGHLRLWANSREVKYKGNVLNLTPKEYVLLELFLRNPSQVFSRRAILDNLWNESEAPGEETVTSHMKGLRRKLSNAGAPTDFIETVYGVGYRLKPIALSTKPEADVAGEMPAAYCMPHHGPAGDAPKENDPEAEKLRQQKTEVALATLWSSVKYQQIKRLNLLKQLFSQLRTGQISVELRQELQQRAYRIAHSLTGVLGIFGLSAGSDLTREMQELLQGKEPIAQPQQARFKVLIESLETLLHKEVQLSEQATKRLDIPLLVLVDPQLEITPALVRMLWEQGLTVKILPHLNVLHSLYDAISTPPKEIQRAHKIEKFNKT